LHSTFGKSLLYQIFLHEEPSYDVWIPEHTGGCHPRPALSRQKARRARANLNADRSQCAVNRALIRGAFHWRRIIDSCIMLHKAKIGSSATSNP
jgi:hypothetical protein